MHTNLYHRDNFPINHFFKGRYCTDKCYTVRRRTLICTKVPYINNGSTNNDKNDDNRRKFPTKSALLNYIKSNKDHEFACHCRKSNKVIENFGTSRNVPDSEGPIRVKYKKKLFLVDL